MYETSEYINDTVIYPIWPVLAFLAYIFYCGSATEYASCRSKEYPISFLKNLSISMRNFIEIDIV